MTDWWFRFVRWRIRRLLRQIDWWDWLIGGDGGAKAKAERELRDQEARRRHQDWLQRGER